MAVAASPDSWSHRDERAARRRCDHDGDRDPVGPENPLNYLAAVDEACLPGHHYENAPYLDLESPDGHSVIQGLLPFRQRPLAH